MVSAYLQFYAHYVPVQVSVISVKGLVHLLCDLEAMLEPH